MKFKIGDSLKIINDDCFHEFPIGEIVYPITDVEDMGSFQVKNGLKKCRWFGSSNVKLIKSCHVNSNCKDAKKCKPHGETCPVEYRKPHRFNSEEAKRARQVQLFRKAVVSYAAWTAKPDMKRIVKEHNRRLWISSIFKAILLGILLGLLLRLLK